MARQPDVIVDDSALDSPTINVRLRVGWLLRSSRLNSDVEAGATAASFAAELGVGAAAITKWEKGTEHIDAAGLEGYERVLGLSPGILRGVVEISRRSFRQGVPARLGPAPPPVELDEMSELLRPAMQGTPTGIDWLHFADYLHDGAPKLPDFVAAPVIDRLVSELVRATDDAYLTRYEAMARLRTGPYGDVTLRSLLDYALAEDAQVVIDLLDVAAERPSLALFDQMVVLLLDPRLAVFEGACHGLVNMAAVGGISATQMRGAVDRLVQVYNAVAEDPVRHRRMSHVFRNLPPGVLNAARHRLVRPLSERPTPPAYRSRDGQAFLTAAAIAAEVKEGLSYTSEVLDLVLFEAMFDRMWVKRYVARFFLRALPFRVELTEVVCHWARTSDDPLVQRAATELAMTLGGASSVRLAETWAVSDDDDERVAGLIALGNWGTDLDAEMLEKSLQAPWPIARRGVYAAGMSGSPVLQTWADDPDLPTDVRRAARWWLAQGSRVTD